MCEFCIQHGEGKKWYVVMENYSAELLAHQDRQKYIRHFIPNVQRNAEANIAKLAWAKQNFPSVYRFIRTIGTNRMKRIHFGQVVPLEDAERIIDMVQSITRIACVCRSVSSGSKNGRYCFMLGIDPNNAGIDYADLQSSLETIPPEKAKELLRQFDEEGLVHSVWTMKTPFIGALCNCNQDCLAYKVQVQSDLLDLMFKAEYVASIEASACNGCRRCQKLCQFEAIDMAQGCCKINEQKCYGCGVCRQACDADAITLQEISYVQEV
ncbi:4Fe-4S dicluster domain-containing protein [Dethiobacter alkaliphilus]|uniref:4Fe-4S dicluster domain-containing protein n=1 Tax=Dethiobacter alkaliphilus TaxID=427926 RepID=UPI0022274ED2|nr:4Fe-4S ferredoxin [Dethiobacter alkaliphilus]MCW3489720.1 4Fe-4S ferredoxin [Dethiobacter alkaliphilus]